MENAKEECTNWNNSIDFSQLSDESPYALNRNLFRKLLVNAKFAILIKRWVYPYILTLHACIDTYTIILTFVQMDMYSWIHTIVEL